MRKLKLFTLLTALCCSMMLWAADEGPWTRITYKTGRTGLTATMSSTFNNLNGYHWGTIYEFNNEMGIGYIISDGSSVGNTKTGVFSIYERQESVPSYTRKVLTWTYQIGSSCKIHYSNTALYGLYGPSNDIKNISVDFTYNYSNQAGSGYLAERFYNTTLDAKGHYTNSKTWNMEFDNRNGSSQVTKTWSLLLTHVVGSGETVSGLGEWAGFRSISDSWATYYYKYVSFNANGGSGSMSTQTIENSGTLTANAFSRTGYTFAGWATSAGGSQAYANKGSISATSSSKGPVTLYARWAGNTYTVTFDKQSGTGGSNSVTATYGSAMPSANMPTRTGYTFGGYYTSTGGSGTQYYNANGASVRSWDKTSNTILYAKWTLDTYSISYNLNGGSLSSTNPSSYNVTSNTFTLNNPTRTGYTFAGWTGSNGSTPQTSVSIANGSTGNKSYTANWTPINYSVTYTLNGGAVETENPTTYNIETATFTLNNPTRTGYTFDGWTGSNGSTPQTSVSIANGSTGNKTYTANWTPINYSVTYTLNGGAVETENPTTYNIETATFTLNNPTRTGYTFDGWTGSNGTTAQTSVSVTQGSTGDKSYTANWTPINYSVTYTLNGGAVETENPTTYNIETATFTLNNPTRTGYTFDGWTGSNGTTAQTSVSVTQGSTGDKSYTANWTANQYTVTLDMQEGTGGSEQVQATYGSAMPSATMPTRTGYTFGGYYDQTNGAGTQYYNANGSSAKSWDQTSNKTLYALWTVNQYTIKFNNYDDTQLQSSQVNYGATPAYTGATPTKPSTAAYTYTFNGWSPAIATVTGDATYTAQFTEQINQATVDAAIALINAIGSPITATSQTAIDTARNAYDNLTDAQKTEVTNYATLTNAEAALAVVNLINAIDNPVVYTIACHDKITGARTAYEALTAEQKALVDATTLQKLTDAEAAYAAFEDDHTLVAVPTSSSSYVPTQIANGGFETQPTMSGSYSNRIPNGTNQGWNTTENGDQCFEWISNVKQYHNDNLTPIGTHCVEMNADHSATLYQDLYTNGGDVIRWSLAHAVRTKYCGPDEQDMRVDVGAPLYNGNNIVYPTGVNYNINTNINPDTKAIYRYNGITNPTGNTYGFNGQNLENLKLSKSAQALQWYHASGVYIVPESQSVTRFAFVSEDNSSCGNLLDDIHFSTLIGDLDATYGDNNSVVIKGYWGETDTSKKLIINSNGTIYKVDMTSVSGQNFVITMTYDNMPTSIMVYHEDYVSAARTLSVHYSISVSAEDVEVEYDGNAHTISPVVTDPESGYTLKYGTSLGDISLDELSYTNVGTYTIYYSVSAEDYTTYKGQATLRITKTAFPTNIQVTPPTPLTLDYAKHNQTLAEAGSCTGYEMAYALGENGENAPTTGWSTTIPQGKQWGSYYVWYKVLGGENHEDSNPAYVVATINAPVLHTVSFTVNNSAMGSVGVCSAVYSEDLETLGNGTFALPAGWTNDATYPWVVENHTLKSGNRYQSSKTSTIQATYNFTNPGKISFSYRISSESGWDKGSFSIDNVTKINAISGSSSGTFTANVDAGTHTFKWWYSKDGSGNTNEDAFFIDNIVISEFRTDITDTTCISGDEIELVAIPKEGSNFVRWDNNSTDENRVVTINQDTTITAYFTGSDITANLDPQNAGVYYSTFYHGSIDYALPANVKAYKAAISGNDLLLSEVAAEGDVLPKGNAVILRSSVQDYTLTPSDATPVSVGDDNDLRGVDVETAVTSIAGLTTTNCYVLSGTNENGVGFYRINSNNLKAHKAYVKFSGTQNNAPRRMRFVFEQETVATGIDNANTDAKAVKLIENGQLVIIRNGVKYNAQGQIVK